MVFSLDAGRYAIPLAATERIVRAVEVTPLPAAPALVLGVIDVGGRVLPVFDTRGRLGLPRRDIEPADHFLIARTAERTVVLVIDVPLGLIEEPADALVESALIARGIEHIRGVIALDDGLVLIHDLERFLSAAEAHALDTALRNEARHVG
jgi:purine-binding chemotaxis protein CheW